MDKKSGAPYLRRLRRRDLDFCGPKKYPTKQHDKGTPKYLEIFGVRV